MTKLEQLGDLLLNGSARTYNEYADDLCLFIEEFTGKEVFIRNHSTLQFPVYYFSHDGNILLTWDLNDGYFYTLTEYVNNTLLKMKLNSAIDTLRDNT